MKRKRIGRLAYELLLRTPYSIEEEKEWDKLNLIVKNFEKIITGKKEKEKGGDLK